MITLKRVQETHPRMADCGVYQLIDFGHGKGIFRASFIQICEINTYSPLPTLFLDHYSVCQPFGIEDLLDSPCLLEFRHFLTDRFCMLFRWPTKELLPKGHYQINIQMVTNEVWVHPWSFISTPCKDIDVSFKELYQFLLL